MKPLLCGLLALALAACGSSAKPAGSDGAAVTIKQAMAAKTSEPLLVRGALIATGGTVRLCYAILESYPPQCGQPSLVVKGLDLDTVRALTTANGVTWSDREIRLRGTIADGALTLS
jgi:hypothetical protein